MSLNYYLSNYNFNEYMQRFADIWGDELDTEDINHLTSEFYKVSGYKALKSINTADSSDEAFNYLDEVAYETLEDATKEAPNLEPITLKVFEILCYGEFSYIEGWYDDWGILESDIIEQLPNNKVKNWVALSHEDTDTKNYFKIMSVITRRFLKLMWDDIKGQKVDIITKYRTIQRFRDEYEPNITDSEGFGGEWFAFEGLVKCDTFGELLEGVASWINELVIIDYNELGEVIYGDTEPTDYLYLLSDLIGKYEARFIGGIYED